MALTRIGKPHLYREDVLRAIGYFSILIWAIVFTLYTPADIAQQIPDYGKLVWLASTLLGAATACVGALTRIDLKMELPGIIFILPGPIWYCSLEVWFTVFPIAQTPPGGHIALSVFSLIPAILLLPRLAALQVESSTAKKMVIASHELEKLLREQTRDSD